MSSQNNYIENMLNNEKKRVKAFQFKLLSNWYWFALFGILGLILAFVYSYYSPSTYQAKSTILVQNESNALRGKDFFDDEGGMSGINIQDHIGVLKSASLSKQVIRNLGWESSWYLKKPLYNEDLYGREPFVIVETGIIANPKNIPVYVRMISDEEYLLRVEDLAVGGGNTVNIENKGRFGEVFENEYFSFIIEKNEDLLVPMNVEYSFVLHDLESLSLAYVGSLEVNLAEQKGNLINLKIRGTQANRLVDYLNELSNRYIDYCLAEKNKISENTVRFIDMQLDGVIDSLRETGHLFSDFQSKNQSVNLEQESNLVLSDLKRLEEEYTLAERKLNYCRNLNRYLSNNKEFNKVENSLQRNFGEERVSKSILSPSVVDITDPVLNQLVLKLGDLYSKKEVYSLSATANEPNMKVLDKEIKHTKESLEENLKNLLVHAENEMIEISRQISRVRGKLAKMPKIEQKFSNIKRRYDLNNDLYTFLLKKRAEAEITIASNAPNSQILDQASLTSTVKVGPKLLINLALGFCLAAFIPFVFIKTADYFNNTIDNVSEIEQETVLNVLGVISHNKYKKEVLVSKRPQAAVTESFRNLRTDLEYILSDQSQKVISVQSIISGEGKSFVSANLAAILAMSHRKVLLIETDMRKPKLYKLFGLNGQIGMSSFLEDKESFKEIVHPTQIENLSFIPAGPVASNPAELLSNGRFSRFMELVKSKFSYIVMDNAPVSVVTDGVLVGKYADVNLFVLRHKYSRNDQVNYINKLVDKGSFRNVSLLLNDFKYEGFNFGKFGYKNGYYKDDVIFHQNSLKS
ncbi:GumC family protein [Marinifilum caeruleilacunae]|uniref:non-specific protein-tyrosine kinase n=1 Tax=Marinifilum caeruleilacunae TaxID=2499076 RepID=A0ABX1WQP5_9BACT|nr:polysaccharide biosynthesis tyrosine autokinase [Marinifilum caeruleilacunae]NOU58406.1 polysaccharide biosynthesis tyrosine autokinase [Marinifilum caeruleilacunae]